MGIGFAHTGHEEHLVVHGQAEQDAHEDDRQERNDRADLLDADRFSTVALHEDERHHAEGCDDRQKEAQGSLDRHRHGAEHHHEQDDRQAHNEAAERQQGLAQLARHVDGDCGRTSHRGFKAVRVFEVVVHVADLFDDFFCARIIRTVFRDDLNHRGVGVFIRGSHGDLLDAVDLFEVFLHVVDVLQRVIAGDDVRGDDQRAVRAGSEVLLGEVVGDPLRGAFGFAAVVRQRQLQLGCGDCEQAQTHDHDDDGKGGHLRDNVLPRAEDPRCGALLLRLGALGLLFLGVGMRVFRSGFLFLLRHHLFAEEAHDRRNERQCHKHCDRDGCSCAEAHDRQEGDACNRQADKRNDDRHTGEHNGGARGCGCPRRGLVSVEAFIAADLTGTRNDEQRVVDADCQAQHQRKHWSGGVHRCERGCQHHEQKADGHPDNCGDQRDTGCNERSEGHKQHDEGNGNANALNPGNRNAGDLEDFTAGHDFGSFGQFGLQVLSGLFKVGFDRVRQIGLSVVVLNVEQSGIALIAD